MRFRLRTLLLALAILPASIGMAWRYKLIGGGYHAGKGYYYGGEAPITMVNEPSPTKYEAWVMWVTVGNVQFIGVGQLHGPAMKAELITFYTKPWWHKRVHWSWSRD